MFFKKFINNKKQINLAKKGSKKWYKMTKQTSFKKYLNNNKATPQPKKSLKNF